MGATVALTTLGAMVGADGDGVAVLDELYAAGLPARLLQELADAPHRALLQACQQKCKCTGHALLGAQGSPAQLLQHLDCA